MGTVAHIICAKLDRFTRSLVKGTQDLEALADHNVGVSFLDLGVNTDTPAGELVLSVMMAFSQFERKTIASRMSTGRLGNLRAGRWPGGPHPYGLTTDAEGILIADSERAPTLLRIFHLKAQGQGTQAITNLLNAEGVPGPSLVTKKDANGKPVKDAGGKLVKVPTLWSHQAISYIMQRGAEYCSGKLSRTQGPAGKKETHQLSVPVLVDADTVKRAQAAHTRSAKAQQQKRKTLGNRSYALTGHLVHLHEDGTTATMSGRNKTTSKLGRYMACSSDGAACQGFKYQGPQKVRTIPAAKLEAGAILWGLALLDDPERLDAWVAEYDRQSMGDAADDSAALTKALAWRDGIEAKQAEMIKALSRGLGDSRRPSIRPD